MTVRDLFGAWQRVRVGRPNTRKADRLALAVCLDRGVSDLSDLTASAVLEWRAAHPELSARTRNMAVLAVRRLLDYGETVGACAVNGVARVRLERAVPRLQRRALTVAECRELLAAPSPRNLMWWVGLTTGMRPVSELAAVRWDQIDAFARSIHLTAEQTKTAVSRVCVLGPETARRLAVEIPRNALVFPSPSGKMVSSGAMWRGLRKDADAAGIEAAGVHPYSLRVTFATLLSVEVGAPPGVVSVLMGHGRACTGILALDTYCRPDPEALRPWVARLEGVLAS